jgi:SAM-dependent methyltransferase
MSNSVTVHLRLLRGRTKFLRKSLKAAFFERSRFACPLCGYEGSFFPSGTPAIPNAGCQACNSRPRHRLLALALARHDLFTGGDILHFAAEPYLKPLIDAARPKSYVRADIDPKRGDVVVNIEKIALPDDSFDLVICSHVLEHVDDERALAELFRVLKPNGKLIAMVPLIEGWDKTYEDPSVQDWHKRKIHFGGGTHVRFYGKDFRERILKAGFGLSEFAASPLEVIKHGLIAGERIFICTKA